MAGTKLETAVLAGVPVLVPTVPLQRQFGEFVKLLNAQSDNFHRENDRLREARDLLLPRLMRGEIAV